MRPIAATIAALMMAATAGFGFTLSVHAQSIWAHDNDEKPLKIKPPTAAEQTEEKRKRILLRSYNVYDGMVGTGTIYIVTDDNGYVGKTVYEACANLQDTTSKVAIATLDEFLRAKKRWSDTDISEWADCSTAADATRS